MAAEQVGTEAAKLRSSLVCTKVPAEQVGTESSAGANTQNHFILCFVEEKVWFREPNHTTLKLE